MKQKIIMLMVMALLAAETGHAQRQRTVGKARPTKKAGRPAMQETPANSLYRTMLPATAKVMFVDSMVVAKADFLAAIPIDSEVGRLTARQTGTNAQGGCQMQYQDGFGDRRIFAAGDTTGTTLWSQTRLGSAWGQPVRLAGISGEDYMWQDYPFLSTDGTTLYFSAIGPGSIGGRDIFMTTFDADKGEWYKPENYGLPFNSTANDYLLVIDDVDTLGWLVSDRFQPQDSVCIYTFVPSGLRQDFTNDGLSTSQLEHYAAIRSIRDTWAFGSRSEALVRLRTLAARRKAKSGMAAGGMRFVINNGRVVTSPSQFKKAESRRLYAQIEELDAMIAKTERELESLRSAYHRQAEQQTAHQIIDAEKQQARQREDLRALTLRVRVLENQ